MSLPYEAALVSPFDMFLDATHVGDLGMSNEPMWDWILLWVLGNGGCFNPQTVFTVPKTHHRPAAVFRLLVFSHSFGAVAIVTLPRRAVKYGHGAICRAFCCRFGRCRFLHPVSS